MTIPDPRASATEVFTRASNCSHPEGRHGRVRGPLEGENEDRHVVLGEMRETEFEFKDDLDGPVEEDEQSDFSSIEVEGGRDGTGELVSEKENESKGLFS